jgi:hypothetical protein
VHAKWLILYLLIQFEPTRAANQTETQIKLTHVVAQDKRYRQLISLTIIAYEMLIFFRSDTFLKIDEVASINLL